MHSMSAAICFSLSPYLIRIALLTPVTPARERPERDLGQGGLEVVFEQT